MSSNPQQPTYIIPPPSSPNWKTPLVAAILALLIASNIYLYVQVGRIRSDSRNEMAKLTSDLDGAIAKMRIDSAEAVQRAHHSVELLQSQLEEERRAARNAVGQAKVEAEQRVAALQNQLASEQQAIAAVKQATDTAATQLQGVSTDVGNVKTDLQTTKSQLEETVANLKRVRGDLDNDTSLIATNGKELEALKELGERNYEQFTINKAKKPTRVAGVMIELKKADPKHNRFTIVITADDKTVEKKDRTINEPIQFYTASSHQPDEIVVNQVHKNQIVGYLATPKVQTPRGT
jgi:chromosome segregation ATPase